MYFNQQVFETLDLEKLYPLLLVAGPSGAGKTSVMKKLFLQDKIKQIANFTERSTVTTESLVQNNIKKLISFTTRSPRTHNNEVNGKEYYFITNEQYFKLLEEGKILESTEYSPGVYYGLFVEEFVNKLSEGICYNVVDCVGVKSFNIYKKSVSIFLYTTLRDAETQMIERGDSDIDIKDRIAKYNQEIEYRIECQYVIPNHNGFFENTVNILEEIVKVELLKLSPKI
jgi:guanylate kinase